MPIYDWFCKKCKQEKGLFKKSFDEYRDPPKPEEADPCTEGEHDWDKLPPANLKVTKGPGWGPGKGYH